MTMLFCIAESEIKVIHTYIHTGDEHIANGFNNYFVNVGPSLADNIPATDTQFSQYLSASTNVKNSLFLNPVTDVEILQLVAK